MANFRTHIAVNFLNNTLAYAIPVFLLQFLIQPVLASKLGSELNGFFLTILAINYFFVYCTSGILHQTRLLENEKYKALGLHGDFLRILIVMSVICVSVTLSAMYLYGHAIVDALDYVLLTIMTLLFLIHDYISVEYRIKLDFKRILTSNIILSFGYLLGIAYFCNISQRWQYVFIIAYAFAELYDFIHTKFWKETLSITPLLKRTTKKYFTLLSASIIVSAVSYGDRIFIYPITDGESVSIITSAELIGKMLMLISAPLSSFILSYLVKTNFFVIKINFKMIMAIIILCVIIYIICIIISHPLLHALYPKWAEKSLGYVPLITITSIINFISQLYNTYLIRFYSAKWQVVINAVYFVLYFLLSIVSLINWGLYGFCMGTVCASLMRFILMMYIPKLKPALISDK